MKITAVNILKELSDSYEAESLVPDKNKDDEIIEVEVVDEEEPNKTDQDIADTVAAVEELEDDIKTTAEMVTIREVSNRGEKLLVVDAHELAQFMESSNEDDEKAAFETICDKNLIHDVDEYKFAILIDKERLNALKEAAEEEKDPEVKSRLKLGLARQNTYLRNIKNKGIELVSAKKTEK